MMIRSAQESDLPAILAIYNDAILTTTAVYDYEAHSFERRSQWFKEKQALGFPVVVAECEGQVAGFATYGPFRAWAAYQFTAEHSLYVDTRFRRRGIARELLKEIIRLAGENNIHTLIAGIDAANEVSIRLHREFLFEEAGLFRQVGYKFDRWLDLLCMQRILKK